MSAAKAGMKIPVAAPAGAGMKIPAAARAGAGMKIPAAAVLPLQNEADQADHERTAREVVRPRFARREDHRPHGRRIPFERAGVVDRTVDCGENDCSYQ